MSEPLELRRQAAVELVPTAPFLFDATLHKPDHFPLADNRWTAGIRWQTMRWHDRTLGLKFENQGSVDHPRLMLWVFSRGELEQPFMDGLLAEIEYRYRFQMDLGEFCRRFAFDPRLGPLLERWRGMRPLNCNSLYEYLVIATVLQNATVRRSVSMMQAMFERYGTLLAYDGQALYCYWAPEAIHLATEQELRDLKLGYRARSIKRVAEAFVDGQVDESDLRKRSRSEQREALLSLYGIGPASVGYILTDVFHHLDEMEHISPWEQKIYSRLFFGRDLGDPVPVGELKTFFETEYGAYRGLAVHYYWEDLFWRRLNQPVEWLEKLIRL